MWWRRKAIKEMTNLNLLTVEHWAEIKYEISLLLQKNVLQKKLLCCLKHIKDKKRTVENGSVAETNERARTGFRNIRQKNQNKQQ